MPATQFLKTTAKALREIVVILAGPPQVFAFLPAITLGAYWLGGERSLLLAAVIVPTAFALAGLFSQVRRPEAAEDPWQSVPGRPAALSRLAALLDRPEPERNGVAVLVLGLDDSRDVEKRLGPAGFGDVMSRLGDRLEASVRSTDLVVRLTSSTFAIVLTSTRSDHIESMLELCARLQSAAAAPLTLGATRVYVTASVGMARPSSPHVETPEALIAAAEAAHGEAAAHGPGSVRARDLNAPAPARPLSPLADEVAQALSEGQVLPWFQPQVRTDTGALSGAEALARWSHPERGLIQPSELLPAIAAAGQCERLGAVMLHRSLSALRRFDDQGLSVPSVAVNFSSAELRNPGLVEKVRWELDRADLAPGRLTIEVLETVMDVTHDDIVTRNLAGLAALGCRIDLDDFGTGHAAIGNIRRFSVQRVKIDRSFVTRLDTDAEQQSVVAAMILMSERLGLDTLAEGVETMAEHAALTRLGCRHVQGFAIARPMPEVAFANWVAAREAQHSDGTPDAEVDPVQTGKTA